MADACMPLQELIQDLQDEVGPVRYARADLRLRHPVVKQDMVSRLVDGAPSNIDGIAVQGVDTLDGVKYHLAHEGWLLIRPSGTEQVLRVYAEAPSDEGVKSLLRFGQEVAANG
jgi:phosphomannomutase